MNTNTQQIKYGFPKGYSIMFIQGRAQPFTVKAWEDVVVGFAATWAEARGLILRDAKGEWAAPQGAS